MSEVSSENSDSSYQPDQELSSDNEQEVEHADNEQEVEHEQNEKKKETVLGKHLRLPRKCLTVEMELILTQFFEYLVGPDGGKRAHEASNEVVADVRRACYILGAKSFSDFFDRQKFKRIYLGYLDSQEYAGDSKKKYLYSMIDFATFVQTEEIEIPNVESSTIANMRLQFQKWRVSYNKEGRKRFWMRQEEDYEMLITPEQVRIYLQSSHALRAKSLFESLASVERDVSVEENLVIRDHLIASIQFSNGHRSGVVANMKISEFRKFKVVEEMYQVKVADHKNFDYCGHAIVSVSKEIFDMLLTYVDKIRCQTNPKCDNVFLSHTGNALKSGDISKRIHILWVNAGIFQGKEIPKNLSSNIIRKSTASGTRAANTGDYQEIADLMAHAVTTAEKHYHIRKRSETAAKASKIVSKFFMKSSTPIKTQETISSYTNIRSPKRSWNVKEIQELQTLFADEISEGSININTVRKKKDSLSILDASDKQIADKVRSLSCYKSPIAKRDGFRGKRVKLFSAEELKVLRSSCAHIIENDEVSLNRKEVYTAVAGTTLTKYTIQQLRSRLQYERSLR